MSEMDTPPKPVRAHTLICSIGADTAGDLAAELRFMSDRILRGELSAGCIGGPSAGAMYSYRVAPEQTHDAYFQQVDAWLVAKDEEKLHA
jgi:hypothetical protein